MGTLPAIFWVGDNVVQVATPFLKGNTVGEDSVFGLRRVGASLRQSFIDHDSYLIK